jgi:hypothetical protein
LVTCKISVKHMTETIHSASSKGETRILYLTKVYPYPPALAGDAVYSRGIIEALSSYSTLTVLCCDNGGNQDRTPGIEWCVVDVPKVGQALSVFSGLPLISWRHATKSFQEALNSLLRESWDAIVLDNIGVVHALRAAESYRKKRPGTKIVYVSHEHEYPTRSAKYGTYGMGVAKRLASQRDLTKVRSGEYALLRQADLVTTISVADIDAFREIAPEQDYHLLLPGYGGPVLELRHIDASTPRRILLLGGRRSEQKRQILLDWLDASYDRLLLEEIETVVAGDMDEGFRRQIAEKFPSVQVLGFVADLRGLITSARIGVIADTVGGGFKLRLLSHVFERLPIVGLGDAIAGLPTHSGRGYLGAQNMQELLELVCSVIDDTETLNALQNHAFEDCESEFAWSSRGAGLALAIEGHHRRGIL